MKLRLMPKLIWSVSLKGLEVELLMAAVSAINSLIKYTPGIMKDKTLGNPFNFFVDWLPVHCKWAVINVQFTYDNSTDI